MWHLSQHTKKTCLCPNTLNFYVNWVLHTITHIITYLHQRGMKTFIKDKYTPALSNEHFRDKQRYLLWKIKRTVSLTLGKNGKNLIRRESMTDRRGSLRKYR